LKLSPEEKILAEARELFILYGFNGTTIDKIANEAEVSKTAIHYYFRSKLKLFEKVFPGIIEDFKNTELDKKYRLQILIFLLYEMSSNQKNLCRLLGGINQDDWFKKIYKDFMNKFI
jgi:AcrR family transcriptional regulator